METGAPARIAPQLAGRRPVFRLHVVKDDVDGLWLDAGTLQVVPVSAAASWRFCSTLRPSNISMWKVGMRV